MIIYNNWDEFQRLENTAVALGNFDGVHKGHQRLIASCVKFANSHGLTPVVFTFRTHPRNRIPGMKPVLSILRPEKKDAIIESLGTEILVDVPFDDEIMTMPTEDFARRILAEKLGAKAAFCGFNYHFGHMAKGDAALLAQYGKELGFAVHEMKPYKIEGNVVSSTLIRTLIASGRVDRCEAYMGRHYEIEGEVVVGNKLGRKLGFPTSNLNIDETMVTPPNGVYATNCIYNGVRYPSITNVGVRPTVGGGKKNVETHIFDFDRILYGKWITVEFLEKTRDEVKFDSVEDLSEQIIRDCNEVRKYHERLAKRRQKKETSE